MNIFKQFAQNVIEPFAATFPIQYFTGSNNYQIAYRHIHQHEKQDNLVVLVNGRAENILKWTEVAYHCYIQGYDVLIIDHRGQGFSQRLLSDPEKGYIDEFRFYADDLDLFMQHIDLTAHSLGALMICPKKVRLI